MRSWIDATDERQAHAPRVLAMAPGIANYGFHLTRYAS